MARREVRAAEARDGSVEQAIMGAAEELLEQSLLEEVSVERIIRAAGVSRATFYFYFKSKYAVLAALFRGILDDVYDVFTSNWFARTEEAPEQALREALRASFALFQSHAPVLRAAADYARTEPEVGQSFAAMISRLVDAASAQIDRERAAGVGLPGIDSRALAATMIWMNERCFYVTSLGAESAFPSDQAMIDALAAVWTAAIYGPTAA